MLLGDFEQGLVHVLGHPRGVATDIEGGSVAEPGPEFRAVLHHEMLDVEFFLLVARPRDIEFRKRAVGEVALDLVLIEIVGGAVGIAKEQPIPALRGSRLAVFEKCAERRDSSAWATHDDVGIAVSRQPECAVAMHINPRLRSTVQPVREEGGTNPTAVATLRLIADDADAKVDFTRMGARAGGDRVEARLEFFQDRDELLCIG